MTLTGQLLDASDRPRANTAVSFLPESNPQPGPTGTLTAIVVNTTTDAQGNINVVLDQGIYLVSVGLYSRDRFRIEVPEGEENTTEDIKNLFWTPPTEAPVLPQSGLNFRIHNGYFQLLNVETGLFFTPRYVGQPGAEQIETVIPGDA